MRGLPKTPTMIKSAPAPGPQGPPPERPLRLSVLGGLSLTVDGAPAEELLAQPKRVAVLLYLALATGAEVRREELLAMFWPELAERAARAALSQALSFLRRILGEDRIESRGPGELRLRRGGFTSDALEFEAALDAGNLQDAVARYRGPLLPGFALAGAEGFNDWLDRLRDRLRSRYIRGLEDLARQTGASIGAAAAAEWWDRLVALEPLSDHYNAGLIRCLVAAGERERALRHTAAHRALLQRDLDLDAGVEVEAAVQATRSSPPASRRAHPDDSAVPARSVDPDPILPSRTPPDGSRKRPWRLVAGGTVFLAIASLAAVVLRPSDQSPPTDGILVLTFVQRGGQEDLAGLGELVSGWIIDGLVRADLPVVDPLGALRLSGKSAGLLDDRLADDSLIEVGRSLRASLIVSGTIDYPGDSAVFRSKVVDAVNGTIRGTVRLAVPRRHAASLGVQEVRNRVVGLIASSQDEILQTMGGRSLSPPTLPAYRRFLAGIELFQQDEYRPALAALLEAARLDTTFVIAALWARYSAHNSGDGRLVDSIGRAIAQILERKPDRLSSFERFALQSETPLADTNPATLRKALIGAARLAPGSSFSFLLGALEASRFRWAAALAHYQEVDENAGWAVSWDELAVTKARAYHMIGQLEAELAVVREGLLDAPSNRFLRAFEVAGLAILGRTEEFRAALAAAEQLLDGSGFSALRFYHLVGMELLAHGAPVEGREVLGRARAWMAAHPTDRSWPDYRVEIALGLEELDVAETEVQRAIRDQEQKGQPVSFLRLGMAGAIAAKLGRAAEAAAFSERIATDSIARPVDMFNPRWARLLAQAWIATSLGQRDSAISRLSGIPGTIPDGDWVGRQAGWEIEHGPLLSPLRNDPRFGKLARRP